MLAGNMLSNPLNDDGDGYYDEDGDVDNLITFFQKKAESSSKQNEQGTVFWHVS